ncbi:MAG: histidinol dehydrogenase [Planctomycetaceae bacterium]|jgi:histidinol dehydrogenase|nr:histidinol dehydrogenase [Planctomycetaceae bacterium]
MTGFLQTCTSTALCPPLFLHYLFRYNIGMNILHIDTRSSDAVQLIRQLRKKLSLQGDIISESSRQRTIDTFGEPLTPRQVVNVICNDVETKGLSALLEYSKKIDGWKETADGRRQTAADMRVPLEELQSAAKNADQNLLATVQRVRQNVREFQEAILHKSVHLKRLGGYLEQRYRPLRRIGICVPGGAAAYPSTVLMTAVPAQVAGVKEIALMAPPTPFGAYNTDMLAVCYELGITEIYRMGGAQGVAALAYGVEGIPQVDKIVGPGNQYVALAKQKVFGTVDIDSIAGPSEVVVIVDETTHPVYTAYDMLAQAEHSPGASILIGWDQSVLESAERAMEEQIGKVERGALALQSLESYGAVILTQDADEACRLTDDIAPEHLHIATANAEELADKISFAGAMFLGNHTPVAVGDYAAGPSHVLPTSGTARFASGLTCNDFLRANSILHFDRIGLENLATDIETLATKEGLTAHRESAMVRLAEPQS